MRLGSALTPCLAFSLACAMPLPGFAQDESLPVSQGINQFALGLYSQLSRSPGNLFFSPYSISSALAMTYAGAGEKTAEQMADVLHFERDALRVSSEFKKMIELLNQKGAGVELCTANRIWGQENVTFLPSYLRVLKDCYKVTPATADFKQQPEAVRLEINGWVEEQTRNKIKELLKPGMVESDTKLILVNAIYFKGKWAEEFTKSATRPEPFYRIGAGSQDVPMMCRRDKLRYFENDAIQMLELPYQGGNLAMVILLPREREGMMGLETALSGGLPDEWVKESGSREVEVHLPRFKLTSEFELSKTLSDMGMPEAFTTSADFTGMTGGRDLYISAVAHKAFVDVNEEGTEAAAATGIIMQPTAMMPTKPPVVFRADHPFIFLIRDNQSGAILFLGRMMDPST